MREYIKGDVTDENDGILLLANAVIEQAVNDYKLYEGMRKQIEQFFRSDWLILLSRGCVDGEAVIQHLREVCDER